VIWRKNELTPQTLRCYPKAPIAQSGDRIRCVATGRDLPQRTGGRRVMTDTTSTKKQIGSPPVRCLPDRERKKAPDVPGLPV